MGLKLMLYHKRGFVGHSMKQYVNYLSPGNHKFDSTDNSKTASGFVFECQCLCL